MKYKNIHRGIFLERPNRFIAHILVEGVDGMQICHVKNTGRCRELLVPGAVVYVQYSDKESRKTRWDLIAVYKSGELVNIDSQIPNALAAEWIREQEPFGKIKELRREVTYGNSRFDLYLETDEKKMFIEVKGVTLEEEGIAMFPDAPTERGVKHLMELCRCLEDGYEAAVFFVIQMKGVHAFTPHVSRHREFAETLSAAAEKGVQIIAYDCLVQKDELRVDKQIDVVLP